MVWRPLNEDHVYRDGFGSCPARMDEQIEEILETNTHPKKARHSMKKLHLENPLLICYRTNKQLYDFMVRSIFELENSGTKMNLAEAHRSLWMKPGWEKLHEKLIKKHRAAGIKDSRFMHPSENRKRK